MMSGATAPPTFRQYVVATSSLSPGLRPNPASSYTAHAVHESSVTRATSEIRKWVACAKTRRIAGIAPMFPTCATSRAISASVLMIAKAYHAIGAQRSWFQWQAPPVVRRPGEHSHGQGQHVNAKEAARTSSYSRLLSSRAVKRAMSTGLTRCSSNPAAAVRSRSLACPYPVSAMSLRRARFPRSRISRANS